MRRVCWFLNQEGRRVFATDRRARREYEAAKLEIKAWAKGVWREGEREMRSMPESFNLFCFYHLSEREREAAASRLATRVLYLFENSHACSSPSIHEVLFRLALECPSSPSSKDKWIIYHSHLLQNHVSLNLYIFIAKLLACWSG